MLILPHDTPRASVLQPALVVGDTWTTEVVPRLPVDLAAQARALRAFQRVRGLATPEDLLRGLLAYVLGPLSTRRLGAWGVLTGVADMSETAWRKRLRQSDPWLLWLLGELVATPEDLLRGILAYVLGPLSTRRLGAWGVLTGVADMSETAWRKRLRQSDPWLLWLLGELVAAPEAPVPVGSAPVGRVLLVDASCLRQPGGTGNDWRLHLAYDFLAGRMAQAHLTDRHGGERLDRYLWHPGDVIVADNGYGYRRSVATAVRQRADVVLRISPPTFPLETEAGLPFNVLHWLRTGHGEVRTWHGWCRWERQRYRVRLIATPLPPAAAQRARGPNTARPRKTAGVSPRAP